MIKQVNPRIGMVTHMSYDTTSSARPSRGYAPTGTGCSRSAHPTASS